MGYITYEQYSKENSRFHRAERVRNPLRSEELNTERAVFTDPDKTIRMFTSNELDVSIKPIEEPIK